MIIRTGLLIVMTPTLRHKNRLIVYIFVSNGALIYNSTGINTFIRGRKISIIVLYIVYVGNLSFLMI